MKTSIQITVKPFPVPEFFSTLPAVGVGEDGFQTPHKYSLHEMDTHTLSKMCDVFRASVFEKACKLDPAIFASEDDIKRSF